MITDQTEMNGSDILIISSWWRDRSSQRIVKRMGGALTERHKLYLRRFRKQLRKNRLKALQRRKLGTLPTCAW